jgi:hypothetical protein
MSGAMYALYIGVERAPEFLLPLYMLAGIGTGAVVIAPIIMIRAFPPPVRFSGVSVSYNLGNAVFGGLAPAVVSWLSHLSPLGPAHYVAFTTALGAMSLLVLRSATGTPSRVVKEVAVES